MATVTLRVNVMHVLFTEARPKAERAGGHCRLCKPPDCKSVHAAGVGGRGDRDGATKDRVF